MESVVVDQIHHVQPEPAMDGYEKVADLMARHDEFAIVRRFRALNMQNVLYLQAEVLHLEEELADLTLRDRVHPNRPYHSKDWWSLANGERKGDRDQWKKILQLREILSLYNDAVLKQAQLARLDTPSRQNLEFLRSWLERPQMGNFPLLGLDMLAWDSTYEKDLVSIQAAGCTDPLTRVVLEKVIPLYHRVIGERIKKPNFSEPDIFTYDDSHLTAAIYGISTVIASILPIFSVVALYYVKSNGIRLGLTVVFCALFALALVLVTKARKVEIFAATAAFAAVNVVFLTNNVESPGALTNSSQTGG